MEESSLVENNAPIAREKETRVLLGQEPVRAMRLVFAGPEHYQGELSTLEARGLDMERRLFKEMKDGNSVDMRQVSGLLEINFRIVCFEEAEVTWAEADALGREMSNIQKSTDEISETHGRAARISTQEIVHAGRAMVAASAERPDASVVSQYLERLGDGLVSDVEFVEEGHADAIVQNMMPTHDTGRFTAEEIDTKRRERDERQRERNEAKRLRGENYKELALKLRYPNS